MSEESVVRDLVDRWERVWHEGRYDLVAECVAQVYTRHDESGTRQVTPEEYAAEIAAARLERPNTRFIVYDHEIAGNRAWFRFTLTWTDARTGETRTRAGMQLVGSSPSARQCGSTSKTRTAAQRTAPERIRRALHLKRTRQHGGHLDGQVRSPSHRRLHSRSPGWCDAWRLASCRIPSKFWAQWLRRDYRRSS
jgi:hypothetical protein